MSPEASPSVLVCKEGIPDIEPEPIPIGRTALKTRFVSLRASGASYAAIAKELHVSKGTLANWSRELEAEIASARAMELEELQESFYMLKEGRIRFLGGLMAKLSDELATRDLSEVSTDKLLDLTLRTYSELLEQHVETRPLSDAERSGFTRAEDETEPILNAEQVARLAEKTLRRYEAGIIDETRTRHELAILRDLSRVLELTVLDAKLSRLEDALEGRR